MKNIFSRFIILFTSTWYLQSLSGELAAQSISISSDLYSVLQNGIANGQFAMDKTWATGRYHQREHRLGIQLHASYVALIQDLGLFTNQYQAWSANVGMKLYPLHEFFRKKHGTSEGLVRQTKSAALPCPTWGESGRMVFAHEPFISFGYIREKKSYLYIPASVLQSPLSKIPFSVESKGLIFQLGHQFRFKCFITELGYSCEVSFPKVSGLIDPFGDTIFSRTFPISYSWSGQWFARIGIQFHNNK